MSETISNNAQTRPFRLAHLSDPHLAYTHNVYLHQIMNKRILGYIRWKLGRQSRQDSTIADLMVKDIKDLRADHTVITGDITHLGLPREFIHVKKWLRRLNSCSRISIVPGNHDIYVKEPWSRSFENWTEFFHPAPQTGKKPHRSLTDVFPTLEITGSIALIGLSSAVPTAPHLATGYIGTEQLSRLEAILKQLQGQRIFRIIFLHHPPVPGIVGQRKCLTDAPDLRDIIAQYGCEMVLHGHAHRCVLSSVKTPGGIAPVFGSPSATSTGDSLEKRAGWFLHEISTHCPRCKGFVLRSRKRVFSTTERVFNWSTQKYEKTIYYT